jgi:hypothetical protein
MKAWEQSSSKLCGKVLRDRPLHARSPAKRGRKRLWFMDVRQYREG